MKSPAPIVVWARLDDLGTGGSSAVSRLLEVHFGPGVKRRTSGRRLGCRTRQAVAFWATFPCCRIRMGLPKGSRRPMSVP